MPWLIMNDEIDYPAMWYPTHIVSKDKKLLPVYLGAAQTVLKGYLGIWIKDQHYSLIDHDKAYIFIHDPEANDDDVMDIDWSQVPDVTEKQTTSREHIHIWRQPEFEGITNEGGTA